MKSGYFSTQQQLTIQGQTNTPPLIPACLEWKKLVWNPPLIPKLKYFFWRVLRNALSTGDNLRKRGMLTNTLCSCCGENETVDHIFLQCRNAKELWNQELWTTPIIIDTAATFASVLQASYQWINLPPLGVRSNLLPWICWNLWIARNKRIFENRIISPQDILS